MAEVIKTPEVIESLRRIVQYIAKDNLPAALRWLDEIEAVCDLLAAQPDIGQRIRTKRFGEVRRHVVGSYLVYYRPVAGGVEILLVVHGAREQVRLI
jgi:toxin ParE1/3/4